MRKIILFTIAFSSSIIFVSCEEDFSPKGDFSEKYILYCIMNVDSSKQTAFLMKSYDVEGYDPFVNQESPFISGADIKIRQKENVYFLKDTSAVVEGISRYSEPINFYYLNNFRYRNNDSIEIVVTLPGGKRLYSITKAPETIQFDTSNNGSLPLDDENTFTFAWNSLGTNYWYLPRLEFFYVKNNITKSKIVPITYEAINGSEQPVFPITSNRNFVFFYNSALDKAFGEISDGDPEKSSYKILGAKLSLLIFNETLSNYYSTTNGFLDDFTIILDEADYTNINGGLGVFGIYRQQLTGAVFKEEYIQSFGYTVGLH